MEKKLEELLAKFGKEKVTKIIPDPTPLLLAGIYDTFGRPAIAMVCWGAFVHMTDLPLEWCLGYWPFFMLNCVATLLTNTPVSRWIIKK